MWKMVSNLRVELYTSPGCPRCPEAEELARKLKTEKPNLNLSVVDISKEGMMEIAIKNGVLAVPIFLIQDKTGKKVRVRGTDEQKVRKYLEETDSFRFVKTGVLIGALSIVELLVAGAVCPPCLILALGFLLYGFFKKRFDQVKGILK